MLIDSESRLNLIDIFIKLHHLIDETWEYMKRNSVKCEDVRKDCTIKFMAYGKYFESFECV